MSTQQADIVRYSVPVSTEFDASIKRRMREGGFNSVAEYVRSAVRADLERARREQLEVLLLEGLDSGEGVEVTSEYWEERRRDLNTRLAKRKAKTKEGA